MLLLRHAPYDLIHAMFIVLSNYRKVPQNTSKIKKHTFQFENTQINVCTDLNNINENIIKLLNNIHTPESNLNV